MTLSKRHVTNDNVTNATKRRRLEADSKFVQEPERTIMDHDSSAPWNKNVQQPHQSIQKAIITTAIGGGEVTTTRKDHSSSPSRRGRQHDRLHGTPAVLHKEQITNDYCSRQQEARFSYSFTSTKSAAEEYAGTMSAAEASRILGRSLLTPSMFTPPVSFAAPTERMMDPTDLMGYSIQKPHSSSFSSLSSYHYNLLLDHAASRQSLVEEELALRTRQSLNALQRDILRSPDDTVPLARTRLGALLPSLAQDYSAAMSAPTRNCLGSNKRGASWLGSTTTDILEQPPHHTTEPLLAFKENQAKLEAQLLANDFLLRRSYGFSPPLGVESLLLNTRLKNNDTGIGKVQDFHKQQAPKMDLPEKSSQEQKKRTSSIQGTSIAHLLPLPMAGTDKKHCHFSERICVPLATDEDPNWLSEFLCFVRSDIVEVFRANEEDVICRNNTKKVNHGQVGIRCRYCAHMASTSRTRRSSSFPFTLSRIYQSLTMMLRDHFGQCPCIPEPIKEKYLLLKGKTPQGASGSNQYWESSARKLGLIDSPMGIWVTESSDNQRKHSHSNKRDRIAQSNDSQSKTMPCGLAHPDDAKLLLVKPSDQTQVSGFLFELMTHIQLVHLDESERLGNRKNLQVGMPGLGCRYCCQNGRKGLCRTFPARRRTLSQKLSDLYEHIRRCSLCPKEQRDRLIALYKYNEDNRGKREPTAKGAENAFLDRVWERMTTGRTDSPTNS